MGTGSGRRLRPHPPCAFSITEGPSILPDPKSHRSGPRALPASWCSRAWSAAAVFLSIPLLIIFLPENS